MKKILSLIMMMALSLGMMAQGKLTPQAQLTIARQKAKVEQQANRAKGQAAAIQEPQRLTLVVSVADDGIAGTFAKIKAAGAEILSRLGRQVVVSIPIDSVEPLQRIEGVQRIDKGHKGRLKTDVTRSETGVSLLNGPTLADDAIAYTGKGVTICLIDAGFDFQHPAFKDDEGHSRIKCVYLMGDEGGHKFTVNDPDAGEITFPGSVYDTPELIASLTFDNQEEFHGSHTAAIAAGSISPQGFGGMAPEADLVLIPLNEVDTEDFQDLGIDEYVELAIAFVTAYAKQSEQPVVLSASLNSHAGPHDGTGTVIEAIEEASSSLIPVISAGNEGGYPIHLYQEFTERKQSVKTLLMDLVEDESGEYSYIYMPEVVGYTLEGSEVSIQLALKSISPMGRLTTVWTSEKCTATPGCEDNIVIATSEEDETLATCFDGEVNIFAMDNGDGRLCIGAMAYGGMDEICLFELTISGAAGTKLHLWDSIAGFGGVNNIGLSGYVDGDSEISGGDWTSTERVISVGAYCANVLARSYDGQVTDTSLGGTDEEKDVLNDIAWFSSYGTSLNNVSQPLVCAPGVNIVSAFNHYAVNSEAIADNMQWEGFPYSSESGTSMACPVVAGIVALWLQAKPDMTLDDVKDVLRNSSRKDSYTGKSRFRWGFGKIDAARGIEYLSANTTAIRTIDCDANTMNMLYDLQGRRIDSCPAAGIYIHNGKKVVIR